MAIYYPKLFCEKGQKLILKSQLDLGGVIIPTGDECVVNNIVGYGFDIVSSTGIEFRVLNSDMEKYFVAPKKTNADISIVIAEGKIIYTEVRLPEKSKIVQTHNIVMFTKPYLFNDKVVVESGEKFYYLQDGEYYNLYSPLDYRKVLRMNSNEIKEYCQVQEAPVEDLVEI